MALSPREIKGLLRLVGATRDEEINCDQCMMLISEFAESQLAGKSIPEGLEVVEHHLSICSDCCEEYKALKQALENLDET